jgi:hypothetical protein
MLAHLHEQIADCHEKATLARFKAILARSPQMRQEYQHLEQHWLALAESLDFAERVSGFIQWSAQRLQPPPP